MAALTAALAVGVSAVAWRTAGEPATPQPRPGVLALTVEDRPIARIPLAPHIRGGRLDVDSARRAIDRALPPRRSIKTGRSTVVYELNAPGTVRRALRAGIAGGKVDVARRPISARVSAPIVAQAQANTCESAALEILLASSGSRVDQARLQAALPTSGPLDPDDSSGSRVWGDPDRGYVGRPDGGGTAGGFGVYPGPVRKVAAGSGLNLEDLSGRRPSAIYDRLLQGRAVMVWVGLSDGPYGEWTSPEGRAIKVNFGEHTVVLHGMDSEGRLDVRNPLQGTAEKWTKDKFELMWERLGRRALGT